MNRQCMGTLLVSLMATAAVAGSTNVQARYLNFNQGQAQLLAADSSGNLFVVGTVLEASGTPQIRVIKTDSAGNVLATFDFGGTSVTEPDTVAGAATDAQGNIVIVGSTQSSDFPLVAPLSLQSRLPAAFIVRLDAKLAGIQFATLLGGTQGRFTAGGALAVDSSGNIYVSGDTDETDFPVTPNAFQTQAPSDPFGTSGSAFLTEISAANQIVFSTYYGGSTAFCAQLAPCLGYGVTATTAMAVDASGNIVLAGNTSSIDLPTTAGVYAQQCNCAAGFIAKFAPGGSKLSWATLLPGASANSTITLSAMALAGDGGVVVGGRGTGGIPVTKGSVQAVLPNLAGAPVSGFGFVSRIAPSGSQLLFSTYLGGYTVLGANGVHGIAVDAQGNIWITGGSPPAVMPLSAATPSLGPTYTVALSSDGSALTSAFTAPLGAAGQAIAVTPVGVVTLGSAGSLLFGDSLQGSSLQAPALVGVTNSAGASVSGIVAPLELVTFYGAGLGPSPALGPQIVTEGLASVVGNSLGGVQVLFDGIAAPLLYAGPTQINAIVPLGVTEAATVQIVTPTGTIAGPTLEVRSSQPQVFGAPIPSSLYYTAAALNQDGTINSQQNPAALGSAVTVWATGAGRFAPAPFVDGTIISAVGSSLYSYTLVSIPLAVSVVTAASVQRGTPLESVEVLYAGAAPDAVQGVIQINFVLTGGPTYQLQIGSAVSAPFYIYQK